MARNKHPEETVQRILTTASKLFLEKGYEKTSLQDIIRETGEFVINLCGQGQLKAMDYCGVR